jgi:hypothetical protein
MLASPAKLPRCSDLPPPCRSLDAGLDGAWVHGLRLSVPFACQGSNGSSSSSSGAGSGAAGNCQPTAAVNLTVYVGDLPPPQQLAASEPGSSLCATGVAALGGQPLAIDCGRFMQGEHAVPAGMVSLLCQVAWLALSRGPVESVRLLLMMAAWGVLAGWQAGRQTL